MTIIKHDRLFPDYKVQQDGGAEEQTLKGVKLYTGMRIVQGVFAWLIGRAGICKIEGKAKFYNTKSMEKFMNDAHSFPKNHLPTKKELDNFIESTIEKLNSRKKNLGVIEALNRVDTISNRVDTISWDPMEALSLPIQTQFKTVVELLDEAGLSLKIEEKLENQQMVLEGIPLHISNKNGTDSVLISQTALMAICIRFFNRIEGGSAIIEKIEQVIKKSPREEITEFLNVILSIADDETAQKLCAIKSLSLESIEIASENIDNYFEIEVDGLSENSGADTDFSREFNFRSPSVCRSKEVTTIAAILSDINSSTERNALLGTAKEITNKNFIYSFDKRACLEAFTQIGIPLDIYQEIEKQSNQKETIEFKVSDIEIFKEYVSSIPKVHLPTVKTGIQAFKGVPQKKEIQTILKKNSTSIEVSDARALVIYMRLNFVQIADDPFVQSVDTFINKLSQVDRSLLSRMANDDADPFSQNKNYIGYFFSKSRLE
ncbi:MAG: hypothetical protein QRY74_00545 [Chlamydia sp.]